MQWELQHWHARWLPSGATTADAVVGVTAKPEFGAGTEAERCFGFLLDISGSMEKPMLGHLGTTRLSAACHAIAQAISTLPSGSTYFVIAFNSRPTLVIPPRRHDGGMPDVTALYALAPHSGTRFSRVLDMALSTFSMHSSSICRMLLLTDGKNDTGDSETHAFDELLSSWTGPPIHCRGIGENWVPNHLRNMAAATMGEARGLMSEEDMKADFTALVESASEAVCKDVRLRLVLPRTSRLVSAQQVLPIAIDLTSRLVTVEGGMQIPLGGWGPTTRDYLLRFEMGALPAGQQMMACRPSLIVDGKESVRGQPLVVEWSDDLSLTSRADSVVSHYKGETEKATAIEEGVRAMQEGDIEMANRRLGTAARLASEAGDLETLARIARVANIVDAAGGTVRVERGHSITRAALMDLDVSSTRTVRAKRV